MRGSTEQRVTISAVQDAVGVYFGFTRADLQSPSRCAEVVYARQVGFYLCRELTTQSLGAIGRRFGARHSSTVHYGCRVIRELVERGEAGDVAQLQEIIRNPG